MEYNSINAAYALKKEIGRIYLITVTLSAFVLMIVAVVFMQTTNHLYLLLCAIVTLIVFTILISISISRHCTRNLRHDLKTGRVIRQRTIPKRVVIKHCENKRGEETTKSLATVLPKLYGQNMRDGNLSYIVTESNQMYQIPSNTSNEKQMFILHFGAKSGIYLGCK